MRFRGKELGTRVRTTARKMAQAKQQGGGREQRNREVSFLPLPLPLFHFLALVSFLARPKPRIPFPGLSLLRNQTETLATQARRVSPAKRPSLKGARKDGFISKLTYQDPHNNTGHHHHKGGEQEHRPTIEENISHSYNLHILIHNSDKSNSW